jgi:hypothetical protein
MFIDSFGQKWLGLRAVTGLSTGRGVAVVTTGADPASASDDQAVHLVGQQGVGVGLPHDRVLAVAEDAEGRVWLGTSRGVAVVAAPGAAFGGDPALVTPQWARTADGASFFLRDFEVNDIEVDPAGQLWFATTAGALLVNARGDSVLAAYTAENSPLFASNVLGITVDEPTGRVYFATERGLLSLDAEATQAAARADDLRAFPSPFRPAQHADGVLISGLVAHTDVRVLTLDGRLVARLEGRGGTTRWNGRDDATGALVPTGVYLVAARGFDGEGTAYGKVAVIR